MLDPNRDPDDSPTLIRSGIATLDDHLGGGLPANRLHLLAGGVGTGKSVACMHFLGAGINAGERVALLTTARPGDVRAVAAYAGVPVDAALRGGSFVALRFRPAFVSRIAHAVSPRAALDDLERMLDSHTPSRIAIDSIVPFLGDGSPLGEGLTALGDFLERSRATALLTYPGDVASGADRRFDGLLERAATVMRLERRDDAVVSCTVLRSRTFGREREPLLFRLAPRTGLTPVAESRASALPATAAGQQPDPRAITLLHATPVASPEITGMLARDHRLLVSSLDGSSAAHDGASRAAAIVVETNHATLDATHAFLARAAARPEAAALAVIVRFNLRSIDRARLLRAGADDVLATDMSPAELRERLAALIARGPRSTVRHGTRVPVQAELDSRNGGLLDRAAFTGAVTGRTTLDHPVHYTVVTLAPPRASRGTDDERAGLSELGALAMRTARAGSGDLVGCFDGRLAVYLHGARRGDASPFVDRIRGAWPVRERGSIEIDFLSYPSDEARLRTLMGAAPQS